MRCDDARALVSVSLDSTLDEITADQLAAHLASCPACHDYAATMGSLTAHLAEAAREPAPTGLLEAVRARLDAEAPAAAWRLPPPWLRQVASLAAVCVLSVFGTWLVLREPDPVQLTRHDVLASHMRALLQDSPIQVASGDPHSVRPWFNGKVEFAPSVKDLVADGFPLAGARLDYVDGRRVATLVYKRRLHVISVFVWPSGGRPDSPAVLSTAAGYNVLSWTRAGLAYWAVSDLDPRELRDLAALLS